MFAKNFNAERAARILVDAIILGDGPAAEKWQVTEKTIQNHRSRLETDPNFSLLFRRFRTEAEGDWKVVRLEFLRAGIAKLKELVALADSPKHIKDVAQAVETVGELQIVSDALHVSDGAHFESEESSEDSGSAPQSSPASPTTLQ